MVYNLNNDKKVVNKRFNAKKSLNESCSAGMVTY